VANWIGSGTTKPCSVKPFHFAEEGLTEEMIAILRQGDIILDCLPGSQAPRIAEFAKDYELHYANLTEYVAETEKIRLWQKMPQLVSYCKPAYAGYIDLLANGLFNNFVPILKWIASLP
jgi:hypothetical protein